MSLANDMCPGCKMPRMPNHTFVGFDRTDGMPLFSCKRDPQLGADLVLEAVNRLWARRGTDADADSIIDAVRTLWNEGDHPAAVALLTSVDRLIARVEHIETDFSTTGAQLDAKTSDLQEALSRVQNLADVETRQKAEITRLRAELVKKDAERSAAVADAVTETESVMGQELAKVQALLEKLDIEYEEKLLSKEKFLQELEAEVRTLRGDKDSLTAALIASNMRADDAEARATAAEELVEPLERANRNLEAKGLNLGRAILVHSNTIGELKGANDEKTRLLKDHGVPVDEIVFEIVPVEPGQVEEEKDVVRLDQMKSADPPKVVADIPKPIPQPPNPAAPAPAPAPVAAVKTGKVCTCCDSPAVKIAKDKWKLKDGSFLPPLLSCKKLGPHGQKFFQDLDAVRELLENPPSDPSDILSEFEDITPARNP